MIINQLFHKLKSNHEDWRTFNYSKGDTTLSFKLRIDIKAQLKDYQSLLKQALEDVELELNKENMIYGSGANSPGYQPNRPERKTP